MFLLFWYLGHNQRCSGLTLNCTHRSLLAVHKGHMWCQGLNQADNYKESTVPATQFNNSIILKCTIFSAYFCKHKIYYSKFYYCQTCANIKLQATLWFSLNISDYRHNKFDQICIFLNLNSCYMHFISLKKQKIQFNSWENKVDCDIKICPQLTWFYVSIVLKCNDFWHVDSHVRNPLPFKMHWLWLDFRKSQNSTTFRILLSVDKCAKTTWISQFIAKSQSSLHSNYFSFMPQIRTAAPFVFAFEANAYAQVIE